MIYCEKNYFYVYKDIMYTYIIKNIKYHFPLSEIKIDFRAVIGYTETKYQNLIYIFISDVSVFGGAVGRKATPPPLPTSPQIKIEFTVI